MEHLKELLSYDKETGVFTWKVNKHPRVKTGSVAGHFDTKGYVILKVNRIRYKAHRVAWFFVNGKEPNGFIDHINGKESDNRICNLRESDFRTNGANRKSHRSGRLVGANFEKKSSRWRSSFRLKNKGYFLGYFDSEKDASEAYFKAVELIDPSGSLSMTMPQLRSLLKNSKG